MLNRAALSLSVLSAVFGEHVFPNKYPMLPANWKALKAVDAPAAKMEYMGGVNATATGYLTANMYFGSSTCSGPQTGVYATATGVCFVGVDADGEAAGSLVYTFGGVGQGGYIQMGL